MKDSIVLENKQGSASVLRKEEVAGPVKSGQDARENRLTGIIARSGCRGKGCGPSLSSLARGIAKAPAAQRKTIGNSLQRSLGNRFVQGLATQRLQSGKEMTASGRNGILQAKLVIGPADDEYEREADRIAEQAVRTPEPPVQRACPFCREDEPVQREPLSARITPLIQRLVGEEEEEKIQTAPDGTGLKGGLACPVLEQSLQKARGGGRPLSEGFRGRMESAFGADFSSVRIHADEPADRLSRSIQARAFTRGHDIFLRHGEYQPASAEGQRLLAHELTHVVQQNQKVQQINKEPKMLINIADKGKNGSYRDESKGILRKEGLLSASKKELFDVINRKIIRMNLDEHYKNFGGMAESDEIQKDRGDTDLFMETCSEYNVNAEHVYDELDGKCKFSDEKTKITKSSIIDCICNKLEPKPHKCLEDPPQSLKERWLNSLEMARGSYHWQKPGFSDFKTWLYSEGKNPITPENLNCWEVLLFHLIETGVINKKAALSSYRVKEPEYGELTGNAAWEIIKNGKQTQEYENITTSDIGKKFNFLRGDIINIDRNDHFAAIVDPHEGVFDKCEVYSLWHGNAKRLERTKLLDITSKINYAPITISVVHLFNDAANASTSAQSSGQPSRNQSSRSCCSIL